MSSLYEPLERYNQLTEQLIIIINIIIIIIIHSLSYSAKFTNRQQSTNLARPFHFSLLDMAAIDSILVIYRTEMESVYRQANLGHLDRKTERSS